MEGMDAEDQRLVEQLRAKYARPDAALPLDPNAPSAAGADPTPVTAITRAGDIGAGEWRTAGSSNLQSSVCSACMGSGSIIEEYNHFRRLERFCTVCEGKGVKLYKDGVELKGEGGKKASKSTQPVLSMAEKVKKLQSEIFRLSNRIQAYQTELDAMPSHGDCEAQRLQDKLAEQIRSQMTKLEQEKATREEALAAMRGE